ncbi:DUF2065 domain-containing protein [Dyella kyungheensis]|uniref:DUF2065 domain-containing protein n=1 Tax=Dyella kyungheensis TaxID=1242174 RepID=UPI003CF74AEF
MSRELAGALCLVLVIEGLVLFAAPRGWQATMREAANMSPRAAAVRRGRHRHRPGGAAVGALN